MFAELALTLLIKSYGEEAGHNFWQVYELKRKVFSTFCYMTACHLHARVHTHTHTHTHTHIHTNISAALPYSLIPHQLQLRMN